MPAPSIDSIRGIAIWHLKLDEQGRTVFFPHGTMGKGRVVTDGARLRQLLRLALIHRFALPLAIVALILAPRPPASAVAFVAVLLVIALFELWYHTSCQRLLKDLPVSGTWLSSKDVGERRRRGLAPAADWLQLGSAVALCGLGLHQTLTGDPEFSSFGWVMVVLAGILAAVTIRSMLRYHRRVAPR